MDTTIDAKLISKMIHSDCKHHHCGSKETSKLPTTGLAEQSKNSSSSAGEKWPPEFLHCGVWPPPQTASQTEIREPHSLFGVKAHKRAQPVQVYPDNIPNIDGEESDSESSESGLDEGADESSMAITPAEAEPLPVTWTEFSDAVDTLKLFPNAPGYDDDSEGKLRAKAPYSVLKLVARHGNNHKDSSNNNGEPTSITSFSRPEKVRRVDFFDHEILAESQARLEITDYLETLLIDRGEYEEGYGWVWPLEDYRRKGWAKEMTSAYPRECAEFVRKVHQQFQSRRRREREDRVERECF